MPLFCNITGSFAQTLFELRLLPSGFLAARWQTTRLTFVPQWSNPLWDLLQLPVAAEEEQISERLRATMGPGKDKPTTVPWW